MLLINISGVYFHASSLHYDILKKLRNRTVYQLDGLQRKRNPQRTNLRTMLALNCIYLE